MKDTASDELTIVNAHVILRCFAKESTGDAAIAAKIVLDEADRLRQLLRDLVDFDVGMPPELDQLDAEYGSRQIARSDQAWQAAIIEVGPRSQSRFETGNTP